MSLAEKTIEKIHEIATGERKKRQFLAPLVGGSFMVITFFFAAVPVCIDSMMHNTRLVSEPLNVIISLPLFAAGVILSMWTTLIFSSKKATPVPVHPPEMLITKGPYKYTRNPMHTGLFLIMIASGIYYGSLLSLAVFTPVYILFDTLMIKYIEEPGLVKRLGEEYVKYRERTPMFFPWR
jgi:protein-S-isoprenylcysteine O-methyltransferase Ste14